MLKKVKQVDLFNKEIKHPVVKRKRRCLLCGSETRFMFFCSGFCKKLYQKSFNPVT